MTTFSFSVLQFYKSNFLFFLMLFAMMSLKCYEKILHNKRKIINNRIHKKRNDKLFNDFNYSFIFFRILIFFFFTVSFVQVSFILILWFNDGMMKPILLGDLDITERTVTIRKVLPSWIRFTFVRIPFMYVYIKKL